MAIKFLERLFGNYSDKEIKRIEPIIKQIDDLGDKMAALSDEALRNKTQEFKDRIKDGDTLDDILPEAFAVVREAATRVLGERHFRVQLIGGIILHQGRISEMRTGEGKTLVSTLPAYLNSLTGEGVHVVTVNDYLARRDSEWMGRIYEFLGVSCGVILHDMDNNARRAAYACDITYATNNELGFDYLRDNMVVYKAEMVQRGLNYAIVDEVDSVLIDEARTPLIISGSSGKSTQLYIIADGFVKTLKKGRILNEEEALNPITRAEIIEEGDFIVDEKAKTVSLTQNGIKKAERFFAIENLADPDHLQLNHHINNALKANYNMHKDKDYVVAEDEIVIVDEFTGRLMAGRRYSDGLHQAIEAKEGVAVKKESKTLATITFQNFFNKYAKKSGMTGTALTEDAEFREIYGMDVVAIPTNKPVARKDLPDVVYRNEQAKFRAVVKEIVEAYKKRQPVLVGTITIDKSEELSELLKKENIPHSVLNAKYHQMEAEIVSLAGQAGAVTIATNMAGRGTDIKLGEGVLTLGGLKIIGTERHESRRIDNQLRGRAGRQGDLGESRFYISLEDDLMRLFGAERIMKLVDTLGLDEDEPIEHSMLTKAIENAQKKVEGNNFSIRKHLLEYDQVMNEQREIIYAERMKVLEGENLKDSILSMIKAYLDRTVNLYAGDSKYAEEWDFKGLNEHLMLIYHRAAYLLTDEDKESLTREALKENLYNQAVQLYEQREQEFTSEQMRELERVVLLRVIDQKWMDHIDDMERMKQGINLRAYAQKDPLMEYKFLGYEMFEELTNNIQTDTIHTLFNVRIIQAVPEREPVNQDMVTNTNTTSNVEEPAEKSPAKKADAKTGRNSPCPCGSGKKYKHCCGNQ